MTPWNLDQQANQPQPSNTDAVFDSIFKGILQAERDHRQQLQQELKQAHYLLRSAIITLASDVVNERIAQNPHYLDQLDQSGWEALLNDSRRHFRQQQATDVSQKPASVGPRHELARLRKEVQQLRVTNRQLREHLKTRDGQAETAQSFAENAPLLNQIPLPPLPSMPPPAYRDVLPSQSWRRRSQFLALLAISGWSLQKSLVAELARMNGISPGAGSLKRLRSGLVKDELIEKHRVQTDAGTIVLIELSELGQKVVAAMRIRRIESEWGRLLRLRGTERQEHSALICLFAAHARTRGHLTHVCPDLPEEAQADLQLINAQGDKTFVFVEPDSTVSAARLGAWRAAAESQGHVALCATTSEARQSLIEAAFATELTGRATDFERLRKPDVKTLWAEQWPAGPVEKDQHERNTPHERSAST